MSNEDEVIAWDDASFPQPRADVKPYYSLVANDAVAERAFIDAAAGASKTYL